MRDEVALDLRGVSVRRGGRFLLREIDWQVRAGQRWVVLGPNGAGKSTLLRLIAGELFPGGGTVRVLGHRFGACDLRALRAHLGWVSARLETRLQGEQTALELVVAGGAGHWMLFHQPSEAEIGRARVLLEQVRAEDLAERPFALLSSGERQRVMLARALFAQPSLLLLDEPCAGLDLPGRESLLLALGEMVRADDALPLVFVTHHLEEVFAGITHALVLADGCVAAAGPAEEVLSSATLSHAFGLPVTVRRHAGRYYAVAATEAHAHTAAAARKSDCC
jgi:iron complex transport system ATP-binding protein